MEVLGEGTEARGGGGVEGQQVERKGERTEGKPGRREERAHTHTLTWAHSHACQPAAPSSCDCGILNISTRDPLIF